MAQERQARRGVLQKHRQDARTAVMGEAAEGVEKLDFLPGADGGPQEQEDRVARRRLWGDYGRRLQAPLIERSLPFPRPSSAPAGTAPAGRCAASPASGRRAPGSRPLSRGTPADTPRHDPLRDSPRSVTAARNGRRRRTPWPQPCGPRQRDARNGMADRSAGAPPRRVLPGTGTELWFGTARLRGRAIGADGAGPVLRKSGMPRMAGRPCRHGGGEHRHVIVCTVKPLGDYLN